MVKKIFFSCNLFQKGKLSYILDSLHVKKNVYHTLHEMNLKYMNVSLFKISYKKIFTFSPYNFFF